MSATATAKRRRSQARRKGVKRRIRGDKPHLAVRIASARIATRKK